MRNKYYTSRDPIKNYFPLPNEVFALGLSPGALAVYSYLMYIEDRTTYQPYAQYLLGKLCLSGDGVPKDKDTAYDWFQKAQAQGHDYAGFFMDRVEQPEPPNVLLSATRLLYHMGKIFQSSAPAPQSCGIQIDRKRLAKLRRMRMAAGHKADDHEQEQTSSTMSMGW